VARVGILPKGHRQEEGGRVITVNNELARESSPFNQGRAEGVKGRRKNKGNFALKPPVVSACLEEKDCEWKNEQRRGANRRRKRSKSKGGGRKQGKE